MAWSKRRLMKGAAQVRILSTKDTILAELTISTLGRSTPSWERSMSSDPSGLIAGRAMSDRMTPINSSLAVTIEDRSSHKLPSGIRWTDRHSLDRPDDRNRYFCCRRRLVTERVDT